MNLFSLDVSEESVPLKLRSYIIKYYQFMELNNDITDSMNYTQRLRGGGNGNEADSTYMSS